MMRLKSLILLTFIPSSFAVVFWGHGGQNRFLLGAGMLLIAVSLLFQKEHLDVTPGPASSMLLPLALLAAIPWISLLWTAQFRTTMEAALSSTMIILLILLTALLPDRKRQLLLISLLYITAATAIYGILQTMGIADHSFWHNSHMSSRLVNSAPYASLLAAALLTAIALAVERKSPAGTAAAVLPLPFIIYGLIQTNCRAIWLILIPCVSLIFIKWHDLHRGKKSRKRIRAVILILIVMAIAAVTAQRETIMQRLGSLNETGWQSMGQRSAVWSDSINMIKSEPLGTGAGCFSEKYLIYKRGNDRFHAFYAHNELLHIIAELGWLALIPVTAFALLFLLSTIRSLREKRLMPFALHIALASFLLHSLVDFPLHSASNAMFAAVIMGCLMPSHAERKKKLPANPVNFTIASLLIAVWIIMTLPMYWMNIARQDSGTVSFARRKQCLKIAAKFIPVIPEAHFELGTMEMAFSQMPLIPSRGALTLRAYESLKKASSAAPYNALYHLKLAEASETQGRYSEAEVEYQRAAELDAGLGLYRKMYADFLISQNRDNEAQALYIEALKLFNDTDATSPRSLIIDILAAGADEEQLEQLCRENPHIVPAWNKISKERKTRNHE